MSKNFNYGWTCPDIDKQIDIFKSSLSDRLDKLIEELSPKFAETSNSTQYREDWLETIYEDAENCFEKVRSCNSDIRNAAEKQIQELEDELEEERRLRNHFETEAEDLQRKLTKNEEELEATYDKLSNAEDEVESLKDELYNLQDNE